MTLHPYVRGFIRECREIRAFQEMKRQLEQLVMDCQKASEAGNWRAARALLRQADRVKEQLESARERLHSNIVVPDSRKPHQGRPFRAVAASRGRTPR